MPITLSARPLSSDKFLINSLKILRQMRGCSPVADHPWIGTLLFYPANEAHLEETRSILAPLENLAGATLTDGLLSVRFLSHDNLICQRVMRDIWQHLRPQLTAKAPHSPRIWQT
jgi:urease accessory protein